MGSLRAILPVLLCLSLVAGSQAWGLRDYFNVWSAQDCTFWDDGLGVTLTLQDQRTASGIGSKDSWLFGSFGAWIKLPGGDAPGTVVTLYLSSPHPGQCEFDFEFLGHTAGMPRKIHTNVFVDGVGGREQQIYMPENFDPTADYHYYSFEWHKDMVVFYVDWKPIRMFKNLETTLPGAKYCNHKAMGLYLSIWDGSNWATEGGSIPINWLAAPFHAQYKDLKMSGCKVDSWDQTNGVQACQWDSHATGSGVTPEEIQHMKDIRSNKTLVTYNYCDDRDRYPTQHPECWYNAM